VVGIVTVTFLFSHPALTCLATTPITFSGSSQRLRVVVFA
jgi:hypothetical protein